MKTEPTQFKIPTQTRAGFPVVDFTSIPNPKPTQPRLLPMIYKGIVKRPRGAGPMEVLWNELGKPSNYDAVDYWVDIKPLKPLAIGNIVKIADFGADMISESLLQFIKEREIYWDQLVKEHIYSVENLLDDANDLLEDEGTFYLLAIIDELKKLKEFLEPQELNYIRIIFH
jgi:hypothetical protein